MSNSDLMLFCTGAQNRKQQYLYRLKRWYDCVKSINADFYCFVDGTYTAQDIKEFPDIKFVYLTPVLGMHGANHHSGWKRSLVEALKLGRQYKYILHIETDTLVFNPQKIQKLVCSGESVCGWCSDYDYLCTAMMALNNKEANQKIIEYYSNYNNIISGEVTQRRVQTFDNWKKVFNGDSMCMFTANMTVQKKINSCKNINADFWTQFYWGFRFNGKQYIWVGV